MGLETAAAALRLALVDLGRGTRIRPLRPAYSQSQWLTAEELARLQDTKLSALLAWARDCVPFYEGLAPAALRDLPVIRKADMRAAPVRFRPRGGVRSRTVARHTGGSTGDPFHYYADMAAISGQWAALLRAWEWSGWRFGASMATVGGGSLAPAGGRSIAQRIYDGLRHNLPVPAADLDDAGLDQVIGRLRAARPALIYGYPSLLYRVARRMRGLGATQPGLIGLVTTSEMLFPGQRRTLQEVFGVQVHDVYGCNETNLVAGECAEHEGWHVAMESSFVEILDDADRPVPAGTPGRIVATALDNRAMAFIRYDTGDLGAIDAAPCACGRGLVRIRDLQGRSRDLVRSRDGRLIHGVAFNTIVLEYPWVDRYQAVQESESRLVLNVAVSMEIPAGSGEDLRARIAELTGLDVEFVLNRPFVTTAGAKSRVVISLLEADDGR